MAEPKSDDRVLGKIKQLVDEEHGLYGRNDIGDHEKVRLEAIQVELDQCWDLLRQRRALREFGENPERAQVRPASVVEKYEQ
jgi:hypothetical protein